MIISITAVAVVVGVSFSCGSSTASYELMGFSLLNFVIVHVYFKGCVVQCLQNICVCNLFDSLIVNGCIGFLCLTVG